MNDRVDKTDVINQEKSELAYFGGDAVVPKTIRKTEYPVIRKEDIFHVLTTVNLSNREDREIEKITEEYREYVGANYALTTASGTSSLHIALAAAGVREGDEVIIPGLTFIATAMAVLQVKAIPIFADIDMQTYCIDHDSVERLITPKTKAIMPVHTHGLPANIPRLKALADHYRLKLVEDASHAHSAKINDRICGSLGDTAGQSLMADKNYFVGGEGGMSFFSNEQYYEQAIKYLVDNGLQYKMSWVAAMIGRSQLKRLREYDAIRARNARILSDRLVQIGGFIPPYVPKDYTHSYNMYRIKIDPEGLGLSELPVGLLKEAIHHLLLAEGVPAREWQNVPISLHRPFVDKKGFGNGYPWSQSSRQDFGYGLENFPNLKMVLDSTLVLCREMRSPVELERIDRYAFAFEKIKRNKDKLVKLTRELNYIPCYLKDARLG